MLAFQERQQFEYFCSEMSPELENLKRLAQRHPGQKNELVALPARRRVLHG